jgi:predicted DNA-binding transcriptional regulator YafY
VDYVRIHRLLRIVILISGEKGLNATRLAERCETSVRNIYRDLQVIETTGIPVSHDRETDGYVIRRDFFLRPVDLTLQEAMALLILAREVGANEQIPHVAQAKRAAEKLLAILPRSIAEVLNELMPCTAVALARSSHEPTIDVYDSMQHAIHSRRALECEYESPNRKATEDAGRFRFDPYALYFGQRAWYAVGLHHGRGDVRTMKLCRFTRCTSLDKPYLIPDGFSLEKHFGEAWRMIPSKTKTIHPIKLWFDPEFAENIADTHWHDSQEINWLPDGSIHVTFKVDGLEEIVWWIMSYGHHCKVIEPPELLARVAELHEQAAGLY